MAEDEDPPYYDDDTPLPVKPRPKAKNLPVRASAPNVERSLDRFIEEAKAKPHAHDVSYFDAATREEQLAKEVADLQKRLAAAEQKAAEAAKAAELARASESASAVEPPPAKRGWGAMIGAFIVGGACVFAATRLLPTDPPQEPRRTQTAQPAPVVSPIEVRPEIKPEPKPELASEPAKPDKIDEPVVETKPVVKPKPIGKIAATTKRPPPAGLPKDSPKDPPKDPPTEPKPTTDTGLYNPFNK